MWEWLATGSNEEKGVRVVAKMSDAEKSVGVIVKRVV